MKTYKTTREYIAGQPPTVRALLKKMQAAIKEAAPKANEVISYGIPTFDLHGKHLVHFGASKEHIGFYATPTGHVAFKKELSKYKQGKGSVQFPFDKPLPLGLIKRIVKFRVKESEVKYTPRAK